MNSTLGYLAGVATIPAIMLLTSIPHLYRDWKLTRRYQRAWDKFTDEWDRLPISEKGRFLMKISNEGRQYATPKDAWFAYRWKYGNTTEV